MDTKIELYHDNFQNFKRYNIPKAQLVIADIPYNIGVDAYASNPMWYQGGDNKNGESKLAKSSFFHTDGTFKIAEYMHFCNRLLRKEPKEKGQAPVPKIPKIKAASEPCRRCKHRDRFGDEFPCDECVHRQNGTDDMFYPADCKEDAEQ